MSFEMFSSVKLARGANAYSLYVLALLLFAYLLNQLDRYALAIVTKPSAQVGWPRILLLYTNFSILFAYEKEYLKYSEYESIANAKSCEIGYGDKGCMKNESITLANFTNKDCVNINEELQCQEKSMGDVTRVCTWNYTGRGFDYQILAGPMFIGIYTFAAIPVGIAADTYNRKILLGISVAFWSICTLLSGFVTSYWQLLVLRFGLGLGQSGCSPYATSLISDYFAEELRGAALGVYNWGIYTGYSMSFAVGNLITRANINGQGWRWVYIISGLPGIILGLLIIITVREPERAKSKGEEGTTASQTSTRDKLSEIMSTFCRPSVLLLCFAGSIRNAAGYVWAYNTQIYFESIGETGTDIAKWLSWVPMVGGSIGVLVGGFISDRFVVKSGPHGRIWVLVMSQCCAAPFAAGALLLPTPYAYISLIPNYIIGEMWVSVTLAVLVELVPSSIKTSSVAVYFFIISNIGGNMPLLVPILRPIFQSFGFTQLESIRYTLLTLYPGEYLLGSLLFLVTLFVLKRDLTYIQSLAIPKESSMDIVTKMETNSALDEPQQTKM